jgi:hypothetical protein
MRELSTPVKAEELLGGGHFPDIFFDKDVLVIENIPIIHPA